MRSNLEGRWTRFQIDAEVENFGADRIVDAHNELYDKHEQLKKELKEALDKAK